MNVSPAAKSAFVSTLFKAARAARPDCSNATSALITAHGCYESGWGTALAAVQGNNFWNLTAGPRWLGPIVLGNDIEFKEGSVHAEPIIQKFRKYGSAVSAVQNYLGFLMMPRYADGLRKLLAGDPNFVVDLGFFTYGPDGKTPVKAWPEGVEKGYFYTLPIPKYSAEFGGVLLEVNTILSAAGVIV